jgi:hypothetical protein
MSTNQTNIENIFVESDDLNIRPNITFSISPLRIFTISVFILLIILVIYSWKYGFELDSIKYWWDQWVGKWVLYTYMKDGAITTTRPNPNSYLNSIYQYIYPLST